ncbi:MAG: hypothetical protein K0R49_1851 [Burkholderiales bacterium]|nr:hypothetical protein [Burkholderiales bacterium]
MKKICLIVLGLFLGIFSSFASGKTLTFCGVNQYENDWVDADFTKKLEVNYKQNDSVREVVMLNYTLNSMETGLADFSLYLKAPKSY